MERERMTTALWWVRRDLRLSDNQALAAALAQAERVVPVTILDGDLLDSPEASKMRAAFLLGGLRRLDQDLQARGSRLIVRRGDPGEELARLLSETEASAIFAEEELTPAERQRDAALARTLPLRLTGGVTVHPPDAVLARTGEPHTVFTPFSKAWRALPLPAVRDVLRPPLRMSPPPAVDSLPIPDRPALPSPVPFLPGEAEAQRRLQDFVDWDGEEIAQCGTSITCYDGVRDRLDLDGTSQLSPYLRFGMLSARQAAVSAVSAMEAAPDVETSYSAGAWLEGLIWREFFFSILYHYPGVQDAGFRAEQRAIHWENDRAAFDAWAAGRTGYPLVDAAMRQLVQSGWLHNRARLAAASFLVKDLLVDWRWGERFFMQHLIDGDVAASNGGWQLAAGVGTGAAPYWGVLNPALQGIKYDPNGVYVRRWLPELARVPGEYIHQPWTMPPKVQRASGCIIGLDYPAPIADHGWARERAFAAFAQARQPASALLVSNN